MSQNGNLSPNRVENTNCLKFHHLVSGLVDIFGFEKTRHLQVSLCPSIRLGPGCCFSFQEGLSLIYVFRENRHSPFGKIRISIASNIYDSSR